MRRLTHQFISSVDDGVAFPLSQVPCIARNTTLLAISNKAGAVSLVRNDDTMHVMLCVVSSQRPNMCPLLDSRMLVTRLYPAIRRCLLYCQAAQLHSSPHDFSPHSHSLAYSQYSPFDIASSLDPFRWKRWRGNRSCTFLLIAANLIFFVHVTHGINDTDSRRAHLAFTESSTLHKASRALAAINAVANVLWAYMEPFTILGTPTCTWT